MLDELPCFLGLVTDLQNVTFRDNFINSPPQETLDLGWKGIKLHFKQLIQENHASAKGHISTSSLNTKVNFS